MLVVHGLGSPPLTLFSSCTLDPHTIVLCSETKKTGMLLHASLKLLAISLVQLLSGL